MKHFDIISADLTQDGKFEVVKRYPSNMMLAVNPPRSAPDEVEKEIYEAVDGKIKLVKILQGKHEPQRTIPEKFTFEE